MLDAGPGVCANGQLDLTSAESDIDCGGTCLPCDVDRACNTAADCQTGACVASFCALVTAGPTEPTPRWLFVGRYNNANIAETDGRTAMGLARNGSRFYVAGGGVTLTSGSFPDRASSKLLELVTSPINNALTGLSTKSSMPAARLGPWAVFTAGELYVFGGQTGLGIPVNSIVRYTPASDTWTAAGTLTTRFNEGTPMTLPDGGVLVALGSGDLVTWHPDAGFVDAGAVSGSVTGAALHPSGDLYFFASDSDRTTLRLPAGSSSTLSLASAPRSHAGGRAVFAPDQRFYLVGGVRAVDAFSPGPQAWAGVASTNDEHSGGPIALGEDGRVYVFMGNQIPTDGGGNYSATVEAYGPVLTVSPSLGQAGTPASVSGTNFAADASVSLYWGPPDGGLFVRTTNTSVNGDFTNVSFRIPDGGSTTGPIYAVDSRARYPAWAPFTRQ